MRWMVLVLWVGAVARAGEFPTIRIGGHEAQAAALTAMGALHYEGIKRGCVTLDDGWFTAPAIWPATGESAEVVKRYGEQLRNRIMTGEGYVGSEMHYSVGHPLGWPLPPGYWGDHVGAWHFSFEGEVPAPYRYDQLEKTEGWKVEGLADEGVKGEGWELRVKDQEGWVGTPAGRGWVEPGEAPFLLLIWRGEGLGEKARGFVEWETAERPGFSGERRVEVEGPEVEGTERVHVSGAGVKWGAVGKGEMVYTAVPMYREKGWSGKVTGIRVGVTGAAVGGKLVLQAVLTCYDTRQTVNNPSYVRGCADYFRWTGDVGFLKSVIGRMRRAVDYMRGEFHVAENGVIKNTWVGHDGRSGVVVGAGGKTTQRPGVGVGSNYWDLLPFGNLDAYATIRYYDALVQLAGVEGEIVAHPEWGIEKGVGDLMREAKRVKEAGNRVFWEEGTGRFIACVDVEGVRRDFGYTFLNLEAVACGFATEGHAKSILDWVGGKRVVEGDTSTGGDIYRWRFGPRASTKRNGEWYVFWWREPEKVPWGTQVQDGGAVLGFSGQDVMARLAVNGAEDAGKRMMEIADWFGEVERAGGYRKYYEGEKGVALQGGGKAGGIGVDEEFKESAMVTLPIVSGFLGFEPRGEEVRIEPRLPGDWGDLVVEGVWFRGWTLRVRVTREVVEIHSVARGERGFVVEVGGKRVEFAGEDLRMTIK